MYEGKYKIDNDDDGSGDGKNDGNDSSDGKNDDSDKLMIVEVVR